MSSSWKNATAIGTIFSDANSAANYMLANFYNANLTNASFAAANLVSANFKGSTLTDTDFTKADLRGADIGFTKGTFIAKNTIMDDGVIKNFSMLSASDNFAIRKYEPATIEAETISAKFAENSTLTGDAKLTLEQGAEVEVVENAALSFGKDRSLLIDTDKDSSTKLSVANGAGIAFDKGAILKVNIIDANPLLNGDSYILAIMNWNDDSRISGIEDFVIDQTIFLTVNNENYDKDWSYYIKDNQLYIAAGQVPEPATYAAICGALAIALAIYRKRR